LVEEFVVALRARSLALERVTVRYESSIVAVRDVSFEVVAGRVYALVGPNGAGKTTLLDVMAGMLEPTSGRVLLNGEVNLYGLSAGVRRAWRRSNVAYLLQENVVLPWLSVYENVAYPLRAAGFNVSYADVVDALEFFGISRYLRAKPYALSGGEQRKIALARFKLKAARSSIILADEPTSWLDADSTRRVLGLLRGYAGEGKIVVVATHDPEVVKDADTRVWLRAGQLERVEDQR